MEELCNSQCDRTRREYTLEQNIQESTLSTILWQYHTLSLLFRMEN